MDILCIILFLAAFSYWFFTNEHDTLFGVYGATSVLKNIFMAVLVFVVVLSSIWLSAESDVASSVKGNLAAIHIGTEDVFIMLLASMIPLSVLRYFNASGSITYAFIGAMATVAFIRADGVLPQPGSVLPVLVAPIFAFVLSALFRSVLKFIFSRVRLHMITLSYYMRHAVIVGLVLTAFAFGLNWGGLLNGFIEAQEHGFAETGVVMTLVILLLVGFMSKRPVANDEPNGLFAEFSIYAVVSVGFSVAVTLMFFSFDRTAGLLGLQPMPLSVSSLVFAAVAGTELVQKSRMIEDGEYVKAGISLVAAPLEAIVLTYGFLYVTGTDADGQMADFIIMAAAIIILIALAFAGYVKAQRKAGEATDRLVYIQQQQIYEHSRALNDMELKVVLSENQALHNAVEQKRQEVMNVALSIVEQKEFLESLDDMVRRMAKTDDPKEKDRLIAELGSALKQRLSYDRDVDSQYFYAQAESLHEDFNAKLSENFPNMTQQEKRLATLLRLGFSSKYIATLMNITPKSVEISRYRLRQKLGLAKGDNLVNFIKSI